MHTPLRPLVLVTLLGFALAGASLAGPGSGDDGYVVPSLVRLHVDRDPMPTIRSVLDAGGDVVARGRGWVDALVPRDTAQDRSAMARLAPGARVEVRRLDADEELRAIARKPGAGAYHTYAEVKAELDSHVAVRPDLIRHEAIGTSIQGRPIHAVRIGSAASAGKPAFLVCGAHHAREWISVEVPMALIKWLIEGYDKDPRAKRLVDERRIWVVPVVNPDGLEYSQTQSRMWRKNCRDNGDRTMGVDPNRNYGHRWGHTGASAQPDSETYRGTGAFSEPEVQAIRDLGLKERFVAVLSFHSYSELVLWPWGYTYDPTPDDEAFALHGKKMAALNRYTPEQSSDLYPTSGDFTDWFYAELGALAYTIELGKSFVPPESEIPAIVEANLEATRYLLENAASPFPLVTHVPLEDTLDGHGPYAVVAQLSRHFQFHDDPVAQAKLVFKLPYATGFSTVDLVREDGGTYRALMPGGGLGTVQYHLEVTDRSGTLHRFPPDGEHSFRVVEQLYVIVDDDEGRDLERLYRTTLASAGLPCAVVTSTALTDERLLAASGVVWFCGEDGHNGPALDERERGILTRYLANGGELLLFGENIGSAVGGTPFYRDALRARYVKDKSGSLSLAGQTGSFLEGLAARLNEAGAVNQNHPDVIEPVAGAKTLMNYGGWWRQTAAIAFDGPGRLAYFGFGLEGIADATRRRDLVSRSVAWLHENGARRLLARANALRAAGAARTAAAALAHIEAEVLDAARGMGARGDHVNLPVLLGAGDRSARKPVARVFRRAAWGGRTGAR